MRNSEINRYAVMNRRASSSSFNASSATFRARAMRASVAAVVACGPMMAAAQSSVTLYGVVDTGITFLSNQQTADGAGVSGKRAWQMTAGNSAPSSFGIKGVEDLGGGMAATFNLQNYFQSNNGAFFEPNGLFDANATVGLKSDKLGVLTLGRQFDSYTTYLAPYASSNVWSGFAGAHFGDVDNLNAAFNVNNSVVYTSPTFGGFSFSGTFSLGNQPGAFATNRAWAVAAGYQSGAFSVAAGYLSLRDPFTAALGGNNAYIGEFSCGQSPSNYCQLQNASELRTYGIGGSYSFGRFNVNATLTRAKLLASRYLVQAGGPVSDVRFDTAEVNGLYSFSEALQFGLAYAYTIGKISETGDRPQIHKVSLATTYNLSKRTQLYLIGNFEKMAGDGIGINPVTGSLERYAQLSYFGNSNSSSQLAVSMGVKHTF